MRQLFSVLASVIACTNLFSSADSLKTKKRQLYFSWGYTRAAYSKSDIHFRDLSNSYHSETGLNNYYDFTVYQAKAKDRPDFDQLYDVVNITIPQYVFRVGYFFNKNTGIELNFDHTKYIVTDYQTVRVKGQINGESINKDTVLDPKTFLHFEHSDGANFWMINLVKKWSFYEVGKNFKACFVAKPGAGIVFPRTDVTLFGERLNNKWHIAGGIVGVESGLRLEFLKYGVFEFVAKGSYANYISCLVLGAGNGKASHSFFTGQLTATLGLRLGD